METNTLNWIETAINNPPKGIKIKKTNKGIRVQIFSHNTDKFILLLCFFIGAAFFLIYINYIKGDYFYYEIAFPVIFFIILYYVLISSFKTIELAFGKNNYILYGIFKFGKRNNIDWKNLTGSYDSIPGKNDSIFINFSGSYNSTIVRDNFYHVNIEHNKTIAINREFFTDEKVYFIFELIKYFRYNAINSNKF